MRPCIMLTSFGSEKLLAQKMLTLKNQVVKKNPQGFRKSKKFGYWALGIGGKKTLRQSEQMKKSVKNLCAPQFYAHYEQKFSNLRQCLTITFSLEGFQKSKKFGH